jgi:hypothetical protein
LCCCGRPDDYAKCDFINEVRKVVNKVKRGGTAVSGIAPKVSYWIYGPAKRDDNPQSLEGLLGSICAFTSVNFAGFANKDFIDDVKPSSRADDEPSP